MTFEVRRAGAVIMRTCEEECLPDREQRASLRKAGYSMYIDGKPYSEKKKPKKSGETVEEQMEGQMSLLG